MALQEKVEQAMKEAMRAKDQAALRGLRAIKSAILLALTEKGGEKEMDEATELALLLKLAKQRKESITIFEDQKRDDLALKEREELEVIEQFLPKAMETEELEKLVSEAIHQVGAKGPQDMGKVMGIVVKQVAGRADNSTISGVVKRLLQGS